MKRLVLAITLLLGTLWAGAAPASARPGCDDASAWPSFVEVAPTARRIVLVKVTESVDDVARRARLVDVMKGSSSQRVDLGSLDPGRANDDCPRPTGPHAQIGDRLAIAYEGIAADRDGRVDTVAHVGRMRDRRNLSGLERLTFEEARAWDYSEPDRPDTRQEVVTRPPPGPLGDIIQAVPRPVRSLIGDALDALFAVDWPARPPARLPAGAMALGLAIQAPAPPTRPERMDPACMQARFAGQLIVDDGTLGTEPEAVLWPRGFSGRLMNGRGELVAPDGTVVGRGGEMIEAGGGWVDGVFLVCSVDGVEYGPAS